MRPFLTSSEAQESIADISHFDCVYFGEIEKMTIIGIGILAVGLCSEGGVVGGLLHLSLSVVLVETGVMTCVGVDVSVGLLGLQSILSFLLWRTPPLYRNTKIQGVLELFSAII